MERRCPDLLTPKTLRAFFMIHSKLLRDQKRDLNCSKTCKLLFSSVLELFSCLKIVYICVYESATHSHCQMQFQAQCIPRADLAFMISISSESRFQGKLKSSLLNLSMSHWRLLHVNYFNIIILQNSRRR